MDFKGLIFRLQALVLTVLFISVWAGSAQAQEASENRAAKTADFSVIAVMGDSLSHSYHDGVLHFDAQSQNYLTILSKQIGFDLRQAYIVEPGGFGARFSLKDPAKLPKPLDTNTFLNLTLPPIPLTGTRMDATLRVNNFAIGGAKVNDIINARPNVNGPNEAVYSSLGVPWLFDNPPIVRSQLEFVEALKPTMAILFIGGNDALGAAFSSDLSLLTPPDKFLADYSEIVRRTKATGAQMILVTVPDVTTVAAFIPGSDLSPITRVDAGLITQLTSIQPGDFVTLRAFQSILDTLFFGKDGPVPEDQILRKKMAKKISKTIKQYNDGIKKIGKKEKFLVVDLNEFLAKTANKDGFEIPGVARLTNKYFGGVASFDGIHITITANAILANLFIEKINKFYGTNYAQIDVAPVAMNDIQVPKPTTLTEPKTAPPTLEDWKQAKKEFEAISRALNDLVNK